MKKSTVDNLLIGQKLYPVHSIVMKQEGATAFLDGHGALPRQSYHGCRKRSIVISDRAILDTPEIPQGGRGVLSWGFLFRASVRLVPIPPYQ